MADLLPHVTAYSEDGDGQEAFAHGDPDAINVEATVASITKVMTLWVAYQHIPDLDVQVEVLAEDVRHTHRIDVGDWVSFRDLFFLAAMPSDNTAPRTIARTVGQIILDGEGGGGDPADRFHVEMQDEAGRLGYSGAVFTNPQFGALMSARQVVDLFGRVMGVPVLREVFGTKYHTVVVGGANARSVSIAHTIVSNSPFPVPGFVGGKTGTNYGFGHVVVAWENPDGSEHVTVVLNAESADGAQRYVELGKVIGATSEDGSGMSEGIRVEEGFHNAPFAGVTVTGLDPNSASVITIWRSVPGEARTVVQGAREMSVTGAAFVEDWGAPLNRPITYHLEVVAGAVEPELMTDTITIHSDTAWLQDPLNPVTAVPLATKGRPGQSGQMFLTTDAFAELTRDLPANLVYPMGDRLGVSLGARRRAPSRVPLNVLTTAANQAHALRTLLETSGLLMLRVPEVVDQIPATSYWHIDASEQPVTTFNPAVRADITRWPLVGDQVRGPSITVIVPRWTYGDVQALYGTYGEVIDGRQYLDWVRDPEGLGSLTAQTMMLGGD